MGDSFGSDSRREFISLPKNIKLHCLKNITENIKEKAKFRRTISFSYSSKQSQLEASIKAVTDPTLSASFKLTKINREIDIHMKFDNRREIQQHDCSKPEEMAQHEMRRRLGKINRILNLLHECQEEMHRVELKLGGEKDINASVHDHFQNYLNIINASPTLIVCGQVNAGKSCFINCLLGDQIIPFDEHPSTTQLIKISPGYKDSLQFAELQQETLDKKMSFCFPSKSFNNAEDLYDSIEQMLQTSTNLDCDFKDLESRSKSFIHIKLNNLTIQDSNLNIYECPAIDGKETYQIVARLIKENPLCVLIYVISSNTLLCKIDEDFLEFIVNRSNLTTKRGRLALFFVLNNFSAQKDEIAFRDRPDKICEDYQKKVDNNASDYRVIFESLQHRQLLVNSRCNNTAENLVETNLQPNECLSDEAEDSAEERDDVKTIQERNQIRTKNRVLVTNEDPPHPPEKLRRRRSSCELFGPINEIHALFHKLTNFICNHFNNLLTSACTDMHFLIATITQCLSEITSHDQNVFNQSVNAVRISSELRELMHSIRQHNRTFANKMTGKFKERLQSERKKIIQQIKLTVAEGSILTKLSQTYIEKNNESKKNVRNDQIVAKYQHCKDLLYLKIEENMILQVQNFIACKMKDDIVEMQVNRDNIMSYIISQITNFHQQNIGLPYAQIFNLIREKLNWSLLDISHCSIQLNSDSIFEEPKLLSQMKRFLTRFMDRLQQSDSSSGSGRSSAGSSSAQIMLAGGGPGANVPALTMALLPQSSLNECEEIAEHLFARLNIRPAVMRNYNKTDAVIRELEKDFEVFETIYSRLSQRRVYFCQNEPFLICRALFMIKTLLSAVKCGINVNLQCQMSNEIGATTPHLFRDHVESMSSSKPMMIRRIGFKNLTSLNKKVDFRLLCKRCESDISSLLLIENYRLTWRNELLFFAPAMQTDLCSLLTSRLVQSDVREIQNLLFSQMISRAKLFDHIKQTIHEVSKFVDMKLWNLDSINILISKNSDDWDVRLYPYEWFTSCQSISASPAYDNNSKSLSGEETQLNRILWWLTLGQLVEPPKTNDKQVQAFSSGFKSAAKFVTENFPQLDPIRFGIQATHSSLSEEEYRFFYYCRN